jgi:hypothetical protein
MGRLAPGRNRRFVRRVLLDGLEQRMHEKDRKHGARHGPDRGPHFGCKRHAALEIAPVLVKPVDLVQAERRYEQEREFAQCDHVKQWPEFDIRH